MAPSDGLSVRSAARHDVFLPVRLAVASEHDAMVLLTPRATGGGAWIKGDLVDLSIGGFGVITQVALPRRVLIQIDVFGVDQTDELPLVRAIGRVQRVVMTDRRPAYLIGGAFDRVDAEAAQGISSLVAQLEGGLG